MKIYKYWHLEKGMAETGSIQCYGGSNISQSDAEQQAKEKIEKIKRKIAGEKNVFETYDVEIREEIIRTIDLKTIITRNRYGAQVLNAEEIMILDIDQPKASFWDFLRKKDVRQNKPKIIEMIRKLSEKSTYLGYAFRIYETQKGIRVIVLGRAFDPRSEISIAMMKEFNCDPLYVYLCTKQNCFRARLTPKPYRIKQRGYKVKFPRNNDEEEKQFQAWLVEYEATSQYFSVCKFVEQIRTEYLPDVIRLHDEMTGAYLNQRLA